MKERKKERMKETHNKEERVKNRARNSLTVSENSSMEDHLLSLYCVGTKSVGGDLLTICDYDAIRI